MKLPRWAIGIFGLCGCGASSVDQTLAEIANFTRLSVALDQRAMQPPARLVLGYSPREPDDCPRLGPDTRAFVDDYPMTLESLGFAEGGSLFGGGGSCSHPAFVLSSMPSSLSATTAEVVFRIEDASTTWRVAVAHPFVPRRYAITDSGTRPIGPGDPVSIRWSPQTDELSYPSIRLFRGDDTIAELSSLRDEVQWIDQTLSFELPKGLAPGPAQLEVVVGVDPGTRDCSAGLGCSLWINIATPVPITLR